MQKLLLILFCLFTVTLGIAKNKHATRRHPAKKYRTAHRTARRIVKSPRVSPIKLGTVGIAVPDTLNKNYAKVKHLLSVLAGEVGKPYKLGAAGPTSFDCSGLINYAFSFLGIQLPRSSAEISQFGQKIALNKLQPGDLLFFANRRAATAKVNRIGHVGCVYKIDEATRKIDMVHSSEKGVRIIKLNDSKYYMERLIFARRMFDLESCSAL